MYTVLRMKGLKIKLIHSSPLQFFRFYLPHGLTVDHEDCLWVTDVGAHQVFKLTPLKEKTDKLQVRT